MKGGRGDGEEEGAVDVEVYFSTIFLCSNVTQKGVARTACKTARPLEWQK